MSDLVTSVPHFIDEVLKYFDEWPDAAGSEPELWFRGVNDATPPFLYCRLRTGAPSVTN